MYFLPTHHPFSLNASYVERKWMMRPCLKETAWNPTYFHKTIIIYLILKKKTYDKDKSQCPRGIKKKTTRDVVADGVRWLEALRVIRACHPEATIILPCEKIQVRPGDDVRALIATHVADIRNTLTNGIGCWNGYTPECRIRQVRRMLGQYFYFHPGSISDGDLDELLDDLIYVNPCRGR